MTLPCREVDGYNPYVEFENGTFIPAQSAKFCSQDAQATQTSEIAADMLQLLMLRSMHRNGHGMRCCKSQEFVTGS